MSEILRGLGFKGGIENSLLQPCEISLRGGFGLEPANIFNIIYARRLICIFSQGDREDGLKKLFVGGLSRDTDDDTFKDYFSAFGSITDCIVIKDDQGRSK